MEGQIRKKRKRYRKKNTEYLDTTILTGTVVFFISTRFYLLSFGSISINEIRQFVADIQPAKMDGIYAVFILVPLARPPPHFGLISKNNLIGGGDRKMGYNKAREEKKWRQWKEMEEQQLRSLGMDEDLIAELRRQDWEDFKRERRYQEHQAVFSEQYTLQVADMPEPEIQGVDSLLECVENEELLHILMTADRRTLQIVMLKTMGYTIPEIILQTGMSKRAVYCRIHRLKKKIKKFFNVREKTGVPIGYIVEGDVIPCVL